jgi:plasmid stabilization system protein ParE
MNYRVIVMPDAQQKISDIYDYLAERSKTGADALFDQFVAALADLKLRPLAYAVAPENANVEREIRQLFFRTKRGRRYRVLFTIDGDTVVVLQVRGPGEPYVRDDELGI